MNWTLLAQLLTMHVLGDFILQPGHWVESRNRLHFKSPYLYLHCLVHVLLAAIVTQPFGQLWISFAIGAGHLVSMGLNHG